MPFHAAMQEQSRAWQRHAFTAQAICAAVTHCWHPYAGAWSSSQPRPLHCCWCGQTTTDASAVPQTHGPYLQGR